MSDCDHRYVHSGVRFCDGSWSIPGSSARRRYYAHVYFCERCLATRGVPVTSAYTTFDGILFSAQPGTADECCVPLCDR